MSSLLISHLEVFVVRGKSKSIVLHDLNLEMKIGTLLAIIGGSGSGKVSSPSPHFLLDFWIRQHF